MTAFVSVIVPGRDCAGTLGPVLAALRAQDWPRERCEVVYADNGSRDGSAALAATLADLVVRADGAPSAGAARNAGAAAARGDLLVFVDADVLAPPATVGALARALAAHAGTAAVFGSYDAAPAHPAAVSRYRNLLHHFVHQRNAGEAETFWAGCGAVRADAFARVGGFPVDSQVEDIELGRRLRDAGLRIRLDPSIQVKHLKRWTLASMLATDVWHRGVPWTQLLLSDAGARRALGRLNLTAGGLLSALLAWLGLLAFPLGLPWVGSAAWLGVVALALPFHRCVLAAAGPRIALASLPLHLLHHLGNAAAAAIALAGWLGIVVGSRARWRTRLPAPALESAASGEGP